MRNRTGPQRPRNADENAMSKHVRQASGVALAGASRVPIAHTVKGAVQRPVLTEVTTTAVNRTGKVRLFHPLKSRYGPTLPVPVPGDTSMRCSWIGVVEVFLPSLGSPMTSLMLGALCA